MRNKKKLATQRTRPSAWPSARRAASPASYAAQVASTCARGQEQRDVDVDALADQRGQRGDASGGGRNLDHGVGPVNRRPQPAGGVHRALGVVRQRRRDFQADIAIVALTGAILRLQQIAGGLNIRNHQLFVTLLGVQVGQHLEFLQGADMTDVIADGFVKITRLESPAMPSSSIQQGQLTAAQEVAGQVVQPDALAERTDGLQSIHTGLSGGAKRAGAGCPQAAGPLCQRHGEREAGNAPKIDQRQGRYSQAQNRLVLKHLCCTPSDSVRRLLSKHPGQTIGVQCAIQP